MPEYASATLAPREVTPSPVERTAAHAPAEGRGSWAEAGALQAGPGGDLGAQAVQRAYGAFDWFGPLQAKGAASIDLSGPAIRDAAGRGVQTPSTSLPYAEQIQRSFGRHDVGHINAHLGPEATSSAQDMGARAFATGDHVVFAGTPDLHTAAHEAAHVVQQRAGVQLAGGVGQQGDDYERHADAVADRVVAGESAEALLDRFAGGKEAEGQSPSRGPGSAAPGEAVQRAVGMEFELRIPMDKYPGDMSDGLDQLALMDKASRAAKIRELVDRDIAEHRVEEADRENAAQAHAAKADERWKLMKETGKIGYIKDAIFSYKKWIKVHVDTSPEMMPLVFSGHALSGNIIELVIDPPVNDFAECEEAFAELEEFIATIRRSTEDLSHRAPLSAGYFVGPLKPGKEGLLGENLKSADIHINFGMVPGKLWELMGMVNKDKSTAPAKEETAGSLEEARAAAVTVMVDLQGRAGQLEERDKDGLYGLTTLYAQYLICGRDRRLASTPKNFVPLLPKTSVKTLFLGGTTPMEKEIWAAHFETLIWPRLLEVTGRGASEMLIAKGFGEKVTPLTVLDLKDAWKNDMAPIYYDKDIDPQLSVPPRGGEGAAGGLFEYRAIGRKGQAEWKGLAQTFLARSDALNDPGK